MASYASYYGGGFPNQGFGHPSWDYNAMKNMKKISPAVQNHLKRVYLSLSCALVTAAIGVYLHLLLNIGGLLTGLACIGSVIGLLSVPTSSNNEGKRAALLLAAAAFKGATLGPLIDAVIDIDSR